MHNDGNESRLTGLRPDQGLKEIGAPSCGLSGGFDGAFSAAGAHDVEGEPSDQGHVAGAVSSTQARQVFLEDHVEHPVQAFDAPMPADGLGARSGVRRAEEMK